MRIECSHRKEEAGVAPQKSLSIQEILFLSSLLGNCKKCSIQKYNYANSHHRHLKIFLYILHLFEVVLFPYSSPKTDSLGKAACENNIIFVSVFDNKRLPDFQPEEVPHRQFQHKEGLAYRPRF